MGRRSKKVGDENTNANGARSGRCYYVVPLVLPRHEFGTLLFTIAPGTRLGAYQALSSRNGGEVISADAYRAEEAAHGAVCTALRTARTDRLCRLSAELLAAAGCDPPE